MTIQEALEIAREHYQAGQLREAEQICLQILQVAPDRPDVFHRLGMIAYRQGRGEMAIEYAGQAARLDGRRADYQVNLGEFLRMQDRAAEAVACYQRAIELKPDCAEAYNNLGTVWGALGNRSPAIACFEQAIRFKPDYPAAHKNLGVAYMGEGRLDDAIACFGQALELMPSYAEAHGALLLALQYRHGVSLADLSDAHAEFERRHAAPLRSAWRPHDNSRDPDRPLRLGFVSADLCGHPVGYFLIRALENLDRRECGVYCYFHRVVADGMTARFQATAHAWHETASISDDQLAEQIRADRIDILFDPSGHTARNRLLVFARKPAPIQITWVGYVGTTGLAAMDYLLADQWEVPPAAESYYAERILRMPDGYVCYDPPAYAPPVAPRLRQGDAGGVTFGSFNNPAKITPEVVACWSRILRRLPQARLILKYRGLDDAGTQCRFHNLFDEQGVAAQRVELLGWSPHAELLDLYNQIDLALDTFPYSGGLTTCESLWMGVPVVTFPGETFASRHSLSHLSNVGLTETIASNVGEYVDLAVRWAEDLPRLAAMRAGLRDRMARSPLCDGKQFARDLMSLLRQVWREWVQKP